jgi:hypothetical protein
MDIPTLVSAATAFFAYPYVANPLVALLMKKLSLVHELQAMERPRADGRRMEGTVVIAGGASGTITASVLAKHFVHIVVV